MSGNSKNIIAFNYFGGKLTHIAELYKHFPSDFTHLCDVFGGSFSVSLNYKGKVIRTANEINVEITNFFQVLRDREAELVYRLLLTPCSTEEYQRCWEPTNDNVESARRFYVRARQSFFGLGAQRQNKGWHMAKQKHNSKGGESVSKWNNAIKKLHEVAKIIRENFQITNFDWSVCIDKIDFDRAFFYLDPPYPKECRASFNDYRFEFSDDDHIALSKRLHQIEGQAMISSYENELYNELYSDWRKIPLKVKNNNIRSGKVHEIIWVNYPEPSRNLLF